MGVSEVLGEPIFAAIFVFSIWWAFDSSYPFSSLLGAALGSIVGLYVGMLIGGFINFGFIVTFILVAYFSVQVAGYGASLMIKDSIKGQSRKAEAKAEMRQGWDEVKEGFREIAVEWRKYRADKNEKAKHSQSDYEYDPSKWGKQNSQQDKQNNESRRQGATQQPYGDDKKHPNDMKYWNVVQDPNASRNERNMALKAIQNNEEKRKGVKGKDLQI